MIDLDYLPRLESLSPVKDIEAILENKEPDKSITVVKSLNSGNEKSWQSADNQHNIMPDLTGCRYISQL
ncbi:uncharacterized protein LOC120778326 [Bactrocera tryoni]|uniref:uncharacterized protein LOC120778326 n=1 Tax=Bactrocera tryoni TaxID=59916 RepID=UPI001A991900|nr:uncharacterized protein LOC120778326 [Bactrocera tryoni]